MVTDTPISDIVQIVKDTRESFNTGISRSQEFRRSQLNGILNLIKDKRQEIIDAMFHDLGRHEQETVLGELLPIESIVKDMLSNMNSWVQPRGVATPLLQIKGLSSSQVVPEPKGVVLVISPWNYPVQLPLICIATALSAGNCVVLKPSEISEKSTQLIVNELPKYVDPRVCKIVVGGIPQSTEILKHKFDHILYTGNCAVGKIVMRAAAEHLTPVTLELGGKCPVIVSDDVNMKVAARRVVWGRYFNAGQSCISCDYVLVHEKIKDKFLATVKDTIYEFYGQDPKESQSFGRIINNRQWQRLVNLIQKSKEEEPNSIFVGGEFDEEKRYIAPTVILAKPDSAVMQDELFGPILPIIPVSSVDSAVAFINERPKPLSLYVFTDSSHEWDNVIANTSSGGVVVNDSIVHYTVPGLPFGGVGDSGMGAYHGKVGFDSLSHLKAVLNKTTKFDLALRYPPYSDDKLKQFNRLNF